MSLNPPLPIPPRTPVRVRKADVARRKKALRKREKERRRRGLPVDADDPAELPGIDRLVKSYLHRHEEKLRAGMSPDQARRDEEYYARLLLARESKEEAKEEVQVKNPFRNQSSLHTAMGRKSALVENAYNFALRQQQVLLEGAKEEGTIATEEASAAKVEELLLEEARANRREGRAAADTTQEWKASQKEEGDGGAEDDTLPSILHGRPRAIRALGVWSARLRAVPYARWTIGAATALDHWIACEVLGMGEATWQQVLEGGGADAYVAGLETLPGGETRTGLAERMRDIRAVREALFPETTLDPDAAAAGAEEDVGPTGDLDKDLLAGKDDDESATEKSIDELLASLGELDDDDDSWKFDDDDDNDETKEDNEKAIKGDSIQDEDMSSILEELQVWRERNASSPYESWDVDRKNEFDVSCLWNANSRIAVAQACNKSCDACLFSGITAGSQPFRCVLWL